MSFFYGVMGFFGFEGLRIYKCLWGKRSIAPASKVWWYIIVLVVLGAFSGIVAHAMNPGKAFEAIYIGFSVPCGLKALLEPVGGRKARAGEDMADDIVVEEPSFLGYLCHIYMAFR